ncbi:unnamed protein product [Protopolystoma xenopodis]|uniref:Uncharacterized protein n=1 Tax=Protopolystoma xenopodis TaxID=117903 RepID=A0A448X8R1_9PLAT|nr:unnamed protein product [Protopolystoma xenopodis]
MDYLLLCGQSTRIQSLLALPSVGWATSACFELNEYQDLCITGWLLGVLWKIKKPSSSRLPYPPFTDLTDTGTVVPEQEQIHHGAHSPMKFTLTVQRRLPRNNWLQQSSCRGNGIVSSSSGR